MEDLSQRKPPQLNIKAEDTTPAGENGALVWSTSEGRLITYSANAGRWGVPSMLPALCSIIVPATSVKSFFEYIEYASLTFLVNVQYFMPFYLPFTETVTQLGIDVQTAASGGSALIGLYNTQRNGSILAPYQLLTSVSVNTSTVGRKLATLSTSITLYVGILYWASLLPLGNNVGLYGGRRLSRCLPNVTGNLISSIVYNNSSGNLLTTAPTTGYVGNSTTPVIIYT